MFVLLLLFLLLLFSFNRAGLSCSEQFARFFNLAAFHWRLVHLWDLDWRWDLLCDILDRYSEYDVLHHVTTRDQTALVSPLPFSTFVSPTANSSDNKRLIRASLLVPQYLPPHPSPPGEGVLHHGL